MIGLRFSERLEANAIIGRFLESGGENFSREDAARLMALIPCEKRSIWHVLFGTPPNGGADADVEDDADKEERDEHGWLLWTVGRYRVSHVRGKVCINVSTPGESTPFVPRCVLKYSRKGQPIGLFRA